MIEGGREELRRDVERVKLERWGIRRRKRNVPGRRGTQRSGECGNVVQGCLWLSLACTLT